MALRSWKKEHLSVRSVVWCRRSIVWVERILRSKSIYIYRVSQQETGPDAGTEAKSNRIFCVILSYNAAHYNSIINIEKRENMSRGLSHPHVGVDSASVLEVVLPGMVQNWHKSHRAKLVTPSQRRSRSWPRESSAVWL